MNFVAVLALIEKGLTIVQALEAAGEYVEPAIVAVKNIVTKAKEGSVTDADLAQAEATLDKLIEDFNLEMPA